MRQKSGKNKKEVSILFKEQTSMPKFLSKIDFRDLKEQKAKLLSVQAKMEKSNPKFTQKEWDALEGLLNLIDSIQDIAVDEYGYEDTKVFKLSRKNK